MKHTPNTLNEEINRMKSLFTEERLYGNLVEQEEFEVKKKNGTTKSFSKEDIIKKIKSGRFTNDNVEIEVNKTLTKLNDIEWAKGALSGKETEDDSDDFGKRRRKKEKETSGGGGEKKKFGEKVKSKVKDFKDKKKCKDGILGYLKLYNKASKDGKEGQQKSINSISDSHKKMLGDCGEKFKEDNSFKKLENIGDFFIALGYPDIFPATDKNIQIGKDEDAGGGGVKTDKIKIRSLDGTEVKIKGDFKGSGVWVLKSNTGDPILNANKKPLSWVQQTKKEDWPKGVTPTNFFEKITDDGFNKNGKEITIDLDKT